MPQPKLAAHVAFACLIVALVAPAAYLLCGVPLGLVNSEMPISSLGVLWVLAGGIALVAQLIIGVPIFMVLKARGRATLFAAGLAGLVTGGIIWIVLSAAAFEGFDFRTLFVLSLTGIVTGCVFYLSMALLARR